MRATRHILMILLVTAATLGVALAAPPPKGDPAKAPPPGSTLAAQKKLAARLNAIKGVSLAQVLGHNRSEWALVAWIIRNQSVGNQAIVVHDI